jgi:hypothetical protein
VLNNYFNPITWGTPQTLQLPGRQVLDGRRKGDDGFLRGDPQPRNQRLGDVEGQHRCAGVGTDQSSSSFRVDTTEHQVYRVEDGKTYTDVLPQINLAFMLPNKQAIRFGVAKELARARMDQLKATQESGLQLCHR